MNTWRKSLYTLGDDVVYEFENNFVVAKYGYLKNAVITTTKDASFESLLDSKINDGYGSVQGTALIIITKNYIIFPCCYDGQEWLEYMPINAEGLLDYNLQHFGG